MGKAGAADQVMSTPTRAAPLVTGLHLDTPQKTLRRWFCLKNKGRYGGRGKEGGEGMKRKGKEERGGERRGDGGKQEGGRKRRKEETRKKSKLERRKEGRKEGRKERKGGGGRKVKEKKQRKEENKLPIKPKPVMRKRRVRREVIFLRSQRKEMTPS